MKGAPVEELDDDAQGRVRTKFETVERVLGNVQPGVGRGQRDRQASIGLLHDQRLKGVRMQGEFQMSVQDHVGVA